MNNPTCQVDYKECSDSISCQYVKFSASVDDRGRISLPSNIAKNIGLKNITISYKLLNDPIEVLNIPIGSKNRVSIPSSIRRSLAINQNDKLDMLLVAKNKIFILDSLKTVIFVQKKYNESGIPSFTNRFQKTVY